jgi:hypothetical protein
VRVNNDEFPCPDPAHVHVRSVRLYTLVVAKNLFTVELQDDRRLGVMKKEEREGKERR